MKRATLLAAIALMTSLVGTTSQAQSFRIAGPACFNPGQTVTFEGRGFATAQTGDISLRTSGRAIGLDIQSWQPNRVRAKLPRRGLRRGAAYPAQWIIPGGRTASLGTVQICDQKVPPRQKADRDEVPAPDGSPEYLVSVPAGGVAAVQTALENQGATILRTRNLPAMGRVMLMFALPPGLDDAEAQTILDATGTGAQIDRHHIYSFAAGPRLYAAALIGDPGGQSCPLRRPVRVGVIDGPVNPGHPALSGVEVARTSVLVRGEQPVSSDHGTAVAGIIAGHPKSGALSGFAPGAQIFAAQAFSRTKGREGARLENIAAGLDWMISQQARIVNMSFAGASNRAFASLLDRAAGKGLVMIAASGNDGKKTGSYPGAARSVIAVTAVDAAKRLYGKATTGKHVEFAAPGVDLYAAKGGGGGYRSGTSFAAPVVAALLARKAASGRLSTKSARAHLQTSAEDLGPRGRDTKFGWGLVRTSGC